MVRSVKSGGTLALTKVGGPITATLDGEYCRIIKDLEDPLEGEDVIIVEDIIDSGRTLHFLEELFRARGAASIRAVTLLDKPSRRVPGLDVKIDYRGFEIPDDFVVGWGMDYDQRYRNLPYIGIVKFDGEED